MSNASASWDDVLAKRGVKPSGDSEPVGITATSETEAAIRERVGAEERRRALDIVAACEAAGAPARASELIASGKSLSEVIAVLGGGRARPKG